jgi:hypothetical protein
MKRGFAIFHNAGLSMILWGLCMEAANYLRNKSPNASLDGKTPYEALYSVKPDVSHLRIIGSLVYTVEEWDVWPQGPRLQGEDGGKAGARGSNKTTEQPNNRTSTRHRDIIDIHQNRT